MCDGINNGNGKFFNRLSKSGLNFLRKVFLYYFEPEFPVEKKFWDYPSSRLEFDARIIIRSK